MKKQNTFIIFMIIFAINNLITGSDQNLEPRYRKPHCRFKLDQNRLNQAMKQIKQAAHRTELLKVNLKHGHPFNLTRRAIPSEKDPDISKCRAQQKLNEEDLAFIAKRQSGKENDLGASTITDYQPLFLSPKGATEFPFSPDPKRYAQRTLQNRTI